MRRRQLLRRGGLHDHVTEVTALHVCGRRKGQERGGGAAVEKGRFQQRAEELSSFMKLFSTAK